ncbi:MAG: glucose-1-phosphate thymidylyltransferase RfbA [Ignavibacteria bacterium]|nr:glucose-1-phosphate thymidylyltransferase RfbA [Ignavibacteria bacterium]MBK6759233.1 glucose-1-phosphate thymidylyltransferase RfbA [Ignavibacteria bacterium]MBK7184961.1 glucose-1-phosphate thymidylyltransferase RfbA [Ignavibacteria bacterium]MBK7412926.1 glucose-1-phosphate thymidylyltransferase RfbA [Ignavibacteria bacterium]
METRGIILAGGSGTRLYPLTSAFSKQLQPVYDKPMIFYPLSTLMMAGIRDVLIISTPTDTPVFERLLGDGSRYGISITYAVQDQPRGIADAFRVGKEFVGGSPVCLILGDNIFYGKLDFLRKAIAANTGATIFGYRVSDPERYGVVEIGSEGQILSIEEKPMKPRSDLAIPGLYVYDSTVTDIAMSLTPGPRGELEITDVHRVYHEQNRLNVQQLGRGIAWLDTGTPESLLDASTFIHAIEKRQGLKIGCLEEVALHQGFLSPDEYRASVSLLPASSYRSYCESLLTVL